MGNTFVVFATGVRGFIVDIFGRLGDFSVLTGFAAAGFFTISAHVLILGVAALPCTALSATTFLITAGGEGPVGLPSFILLAPTTIGDDLFLLRFLPALGVFGVFPALGVFTTFSGKGDLTGDATGELERALDLAEAGDDTIGVFMRSTIPVKLRSRLLLLLLPLVGDSLTERRAFLPDLGNFLDGDRLLGVLFLPVDNDFSFPVEETDEAPFAGADLGVDGIDVCLAGVFD